MDWLYILIISCAVLWIMSLFGIFYCIRISDKLRGHDATARAKEILYRAEMEAERVARETELKLKEETILQKEQLDKEQQAIRNAQHERERQLDKKQDTIDKQAGEIKKQEKLIANTQRKLTEKLEDANRRTESLNQLIERERQILHEISGLSRTEAVTRLLKILENELHEEAGALIIKQEKLVQERCEQTVRDILLTALQRYAATYTSEATSSTVDIPNDDMKGRIIGREGRNIRAFEKATGIDVVIDDTPGVVIVSGYDPIRREIARLSLTRLITDGRIHPSRIEEIVNETHSELQNFIQQQGNEACREVDIFGLNDRIVTLLGRLHFRTSYSQNVLRHSVEVAFLAGMIASELGLNEKLARRCGLLHDIGKATDHEMEGGHPKIGGDLLKRFGEPTEVVHAALGHHEDLRVENPYTVIVAAADACSASRPGARRETLEHYIKRMQELEQIATGFSGVEQAYAIQAGREIRVLVSSSMTTDESAAKTCRDIVNSLTERLQFPGEIKVTVIRETRYTEIAK